MTELIRKWSIRPRGNGTLNIIETDLVGIDRVLFNLRHSVSENDARAISVARESLALLKEISECVDTNLGDAGEFQCEMICIHERITELVNQSEQ